MYYTYMLRCHDNSLYTGITVDVERRMKEHFSKNETRAKYTMTHPAKRLEAVWQSGSRALASKLEYHIKKLSKEQKEKLISENDMQQFLGEKIETEKYKRVK